MSFEYCLVVQMPKHWSFEDTKKLLDRLCSVLATPTVECVSTTLREFWVLYYISRIWRGRDCTPPPWYLRFYICHEVEAYTRDGPWKKILIDDVINHVTWLVCISQTKNHFCWHQKKMADDVIIQLLWSKWFSRMSFNLIACLEPVKQDGHYFHAEILVCKFHLGSIKACLHMRKRFCHQIFFMPICSQGNFVHWDKVSCKTIRGYGGI